MLTGTDDYADEKTKAVGDQVPARKQVAVGIDRGNDRYACITHESECVCYCI